MKPSKMPKGPFPREGIKTLPFRHYRGQTVMTITLHTKIAKKYQLEIRYTPDKLLIDKKSLDGWIGRYNDNNMTIESLAQHIMNDFSNEIIPNWAYLEILSSDNFKIILEDKQPNYSSLKRITF